MKQCNHVTMNLGMSLIELLVSMGIIGMLLVAGIPAYRHYSYVNDLNQAAQDVKSAILETQAMALAPDSDKPDWADRVSFSTTSDNNILSIKYLTSDPDKNQLIKQYTLPAGVTINQSKIIYSFSGQGKIDSLEPDPCEINLTSGKTNETKTITVNKNTGKISIE